MLARIPRVADKMNLLLLRKTFKVPQLPPAPCVCPQHLPGQTTGQSLHGQQRGCTSHVDGQPVSLGPHVGHGPWMTSPARQSRARFPDRGGPA